MDLTTVTYNQEKRVYEAICPAGCLATYFVFPPNMKIGDLLPTLNIHCFGNVVFLFYGEFNHISDNLEFHLEGPVGYVYKASLQVDMPAQPYAWKIKRHGHTNLGKENDATKLFVPRTLCLRPPTLVDSEQDVVKRWAFYGPSIPDQFCKLRLKIQFQPSNCRENPDNNYSQMPRGLQAYKSCSNESFPLAESEQNQKVAHMGVFLADNFSNSSEGTKESATAANTNAGQNSQAFNDAKTGRAVTSIRLNKS